MATPSKTVGTSVIAHQAVTHPGTVVGAAQALPTAIEVTIFLDHALIEATANTNPARWLIQVSAASSGNEEWVTLQEILLKEDGTPVAEALTATEAGGETVLAVASTASRAAFDLVYIQDAGTLADSEWNLIQEIVTNTSINILDGLTTGKDSSDTIWGQAERRIASINIESIARVRVVFMHEGAVGANAHIRATMTVEDSFG